MSPLSKSFIHPTAPNAQPVAARAELFVLGREIVNCYEEENSPFEQRRKFMVQQAYASGEAGIAIDDEAMSVDEDYLKTLEWGLPPTGGWGCGIDRLVMLFAGKERIGDVLSFGSLRAVTRGTDKRDRSIS
jgi:lysyl-tRNA synthetase class 2